LKGCLGEIEHGKGRGLGRELLLSLGGRPASLLGGEGDDGEVVLGDAPVRAHAEAKLGMVGSLVTEREELKLRVEIVCRLMVTKEAQPKDKE
jgi:hypothetical protein